MGWKQSTFFVHRVVKVLTTEIRLKLETLAGEVAKREGCELYDLELNGSSGRRTLRVFIDRPEGGVGIEDCSNVSRGLSLLLDVEDPIPGGAYDLEVSTPGVDRPLRQPWHFQRVIGKKAWMKLDQALENFGAQNPKNKPAKQMTALVEAADDASVTVRFEEEQMKLPYSAIEKAKLVFEMPEKGQKKK